MAAGTDQHTPPSWKRTPLTLHFRGPEPCHRAAVTVRTGPGSFWRLLGSLALSSCREHLLSLGLWALPPLSLSPALKAPRNHMGLTQVGWASS